MAEQQPLWRLNGADPAQLIRWHNQLDEARGLRAQLRRVHKPEEALLTEAFAQFLSFVPINWRSEQQLMGSALVASVLAWVDANDSVSQRFAKQLSGNNEQRGMSGIRFKQLLTSRTPEEFYRRLLRAVKFLDKRVNRLSLIEDILQWYREYTQGLDSDPVKRLAVKWAKDYYAE